MTTKLTVLGCGGSLGVPNLMNRFMDCDPNNPKNFRTRTSAWVEHQGKQFLIDTSPDLRTQLHATGLAGRRPDAVLYTHTHADHCNGMDDLRSYYWPDKKLVDIYGPKAGIEELEQRFNYLFSTSDHLLYGNQIVNPHILTPGKHNIADAEVSVIEMPHGDITSFGYRFGDIAWCTDYQMMPPEGIETLRGVKVLFSAVSDAEISHPSHATLPQVLDIAEQIGNPKIYLIHLSPRLDYATLDAKTPSYVTPAYDGMVVES